jgi:hypothetical protein
VEHLKVLKSSGNYVLDKMALLCAMPWHYLPATNDGAAVAADWKADVVWSIADDTPQPAAGATQVAH